MKPFTESDRQWLTAAIQESLPDGTPIHIVNNLVGAVIRVASNRGTFPVEWFAAIRELIAFTFMEGFRYNDETRGQ